MSDEKHNFRIAQTRALTGRISEFELAPVAPGTVMGWSAGAHVDVALDGLGSRSYSLISWPGDTQDFLRIAVQEEPDGAGGSLAMHACAPGDLLQVSDARNDFALRDRDGPVALLAGGIGVTPLISMATQLLADSDAFVFHYAARSRGEAAYVDLLEDTFGPRLRLHFDDDIRIDLPDVMRELGGHRLYICGPKGFIEATRRAAEAAGIASDRIHVEVFETPPVTDQDGSFEVALLSTGQVFTVPPGQSIIEVLEAGGVDLMYDCQRGDCGICQVDVLEGEPDHRDVVLSQTEKDSGKVMQICVSRAKSKRLVLDI